MFGSADIAYFVVFGWIKEGLRCQSGSESAVWWEGIDAIRPPGGIKFPVFFLLSGIFAGDGFAGDCPLRHLSFPFSQKCDTSQKFEEALSRGLHVHYQGC